MEKQKNIRPINGPIADKMVRSAAKHMKNKVIDFNAWKSAKSYQEKIQKFHQEKDLSHLDPLHALYVDTQHYIVDFVEAFSSLPESYKLNKIYEESEEIYMPSYPPMSPLTQSYFCCWSSLDMCVGIKRETYTTIMIACCRASGASHEFIKILEHMQKSYTGLYINEGNDKKFVYLRELYTNKTIKTHVACGYLGVPGEIWFVRLFSDPLSNYFDYSVAFTTPYVIINGHQGKKTTGNLTELMYPEKEWIAFIERNLEHSKYKEPQEAHYHFMKYGKNKHYWPEYIFLAYMNHTSNAIWLTGFPDKPETLPHANDNYEHWNEPKKSKSF